MDLQDKKVLVVGCGKSGIGAATLLHKIGACPVLYDGNENLKEDEIRADFPEHTEVEIMLGSVQDKALSDITLAVFSPGVPLDIPITDMLKAKNIPIWGEVELAYHFGRGKVLAITGTNGKTTTTTLVGEIMKNYKGSVFVVGNIGTPYTGAVLKMKEDSVTVAEISSFQLETIEQFHPDVSAVLNITPDHLNRHKTMENYIDTKKRIAKNQTKKDICVLNYDDPVTRAFGDEICARVVYFSRKSKPSPGVYLEDGQIVYDSGKKKTALCHLSELKLLGAHNHENVMAAVAITAGAGTPLPVIRKVIREFKAVEHRIEYVAEKNGVVYYNDSKGTNPDAAIRGIQAMDRPTCLIGGGYDKGSEYDEWIEAFDGKVKALVLIGATREKIADTARRHGFHDIILADTLEEAVGICAGKAVAGDAVLLSPACASWGMFDNYEQRGRVFKQLVHNL